MAESAQVLSLMKLKNIFTCLEVFVTTSIIVSTVLDFSLPMVICIDRNRLQQCQVKGDVIL